jgi:hypothetical protein
MFSKPNEDTTTAIARLTRTAEWEKVEEWLVGWREECVKASLTTDNVKSRQAQGALQAIDELLRNTRAAEELSSRR